MSEGEDKRKRRPAPADDPSIPILTERLNLPGGAIPPAQPAPVPLGRADEPPPAVDTRKLEADLRDALLREISARLTPELDMMIRAQLAPAIDGLVKQLTMDARRAIGPTLAEAVSAAIKKAVKDNT